MTKGSRPDRGREGGDLGAASGGVERGRDRAPALAEIGGDGEQLRGREWEGSGRGRVDGRSAACPRKSARRSRAGSPAATRTGRSPGGLVAPTRRSAVRSSAAAGGGATGPTQRSATPGRRSSAPATDEARALPGAAPSRARAALRKTTHREQIAGWLWLQYPDNEAMRVSTRRSTARSTSRGGGASSESSPGTCRSGRQRRYARSQSPRAPGPGQDHRMVMISERPPEVEDRRSPATGRATLLLGRRARPRSRPWSSARRATASSSPCPRGARPRRSRKRCKASITTLPAQLRRSLTWDQGHGDGRAPPLLASRPAGGLLLRPRSPWQRGSNENTNGLLRQYFPKGESLEGVSQEAPRRGCGQAQRPAAKDARLPDPGREARRADRRARGRPAPSADLLRPTAFARQR